MVPIHDTDLAEKRWSDTEWRQFELWEKIELRVKKRRRRWMALVAVLFLILASVPTVMARWPKWASLHAVRKIAEEVNRMRMDAVILEAAFRLSLDTSPGLGFRVEMATTCNSPVQDWQVVREGSLLKSSLGMLVGRKLRVLDPESGAVLGVPGLRTAVCVDAGDGSGGVQSDSVPVAGANLTGIAVIHSGDLLAKNIERISVVSLTSKDNEVDFE